MPETEEQIENPGPEEGRRHGHLCLLYGSEAEILAPVIPFIQKGVALGERCVYLHSGEEMLERVLKKALSGQKNDSGALVVLPARETWLQGGAFQAERMMELLLSLCASAAADGFQGLRIICDMGWAGRESLRGALLAEFELGLNLFAARHDVTLLCLYNRGSFAAEQLLALARVHQQLLIGGKLCNNPFYLPPDRDPALPRAICELDLFLAAAQAASGAATDRDRLRQELEQAYAALARKIYENWQEEDTLRASEQELLQKEEALLEHRRRLQSVLQHLPAMLMAFDAENRLTACNHEFERVTGFKAEEVMGRPLQELVEVEADGLQELVQAHPPEGGYYRGVQWNIRCKDESPRSVSWSNFSRYVAIPGWPNWIMGLDVTPRLHAELGLRSLNDELSARSGELEALGNAVSNDLSGQLARISGQCTLLQDLYWVALAPPCRDIVREIQQTALEMTERITALQRFTALAAGELRPQQVDLSAIAAEIAARLGGGERRAIFSIEEGVTVTGDEKLLRFAMEQLLENAWHSTSGVPQPVISFGTAQVAGERSYFVSDNGPRCGTQSPGEGGCWASGLEGGVGLDCGIGLATVQRIISLHRGRIWAEDEAGRGATFYFRV
jgi:PAS domain S-box-containing protein